MAAFMDGLKRSLTLYRIHRSWGREMCRGSELCVLRDKVFGWMRSDLNGEMCIGPLGQVRRPESRDIR